MDYKTAEDLKTILNSNREILDYFNNEYVQKLADVQNRKTQQFELKVKIDELKKTLDIYSFKTSTGHNVFSPFSTETTMQQEKASAIDRQLRELSEIKITLDNNIINLEEEISSLKDRIQNLADSTKKLEEMLSDMTEEFVDEDAFKDDDEDEPAGEEPAENHGLNILKLNLHEKEELSGKLKSEIKEILSGNRNKLEVLSWMIKTDINRARVTLEDIMEANTSLEADVDKIIDELSDSPDTSEPLWTLLDDMILEYKEAHPECVIQSEIDCPDYDIHIDNTVIIYLIYIIREIFDNAFKHSNANRITAKIFISNRLINVYINDNGVGIDSNYGVISPWYSGLHKINEIIYLLGGQLKIDGDIISGTNVRFSFPIDATL